MDGVSVIMPVRNEERHLAGAVEMILGQDYLGPMEVILAIGPSSDATAAIAASLRAADARVRIVPNPSGLTPAGLNAALDVASYDTIVRVDGHALIPRDYVSVAVETLRRTGADNVGGVMAAEGVTAYEQAVARAMTTRLGVGAASFHVGGQEGPAPTVYLGAFRRDAIDRVGGYDETFVRAQDWELNYRIRSTGGTVWFTPGMRVTYRPRSNPRALAKQYFDYGRWRREVMRRHPETVRGAAALRYLAPPVAVVGIGVGTAAAAVGAVTGSRALRAGALAPLAYATLIGAGSVLTGRGLSPAARRALPGVYATMHLAWGTGFLSSPRGLRSTDSSS